MFITTNFVSSNPSHGEVYLIQLYVIKFISDLLQVGFFFFSERNVSSTNKAERHDITEILLKEALNTIILTLTDEQHYICFIRNGNCMPLANTWVHTPHPPPPPPPFLWVCVFSHLFSFLWCCVYFVCLRSVYGAYY